MKFAEHYVERLKSPVTQVSKERGVVQLAILLLGGALATWLGLSLADLVDIDPVKDAGILVATWLIKITLGTIASAIQVIFQGIAIVFNWVVGNILSIAVAPSAKGIVPFVKSGWSVSLALVNSVLLLILAFIGLATILRLQSYQMQRTLPTLLIVALLVNFSGLIVGFVADIGNLLTKFFFDAVKDVNWSTLASYWAIKSAESAGDLGELLALTIGLIFYYGIASLVLLTVSLAFWFRLFVLWILAILSPIAIAAFVLPNTRRWGNQWLASLLQWSFVGVPMGFFLYLSSLALNIEVVQLGTKPLLDPNSGAPMAIANLLGPFTALFLLIVGVFISLSMAPGTVQRVMRWGENAGIIVGGFLAAQAVGRYFAREKRKREAGEDTAMSKAERMSFGIDWKRKPLQSAAITAATFGMAPAARWAMRTGIRKGVEYGAKQGAGIEQDAREFEQTARSDWSLFLERAKAPGAGFLGDSKRAAAILAAARIRGARGLSALQNLNLDNFESGLKHLAAERPEKLGDVLKHNFDLMDDERAKEIFGPERGPTMAKLLRERYLGGSLSKDERGNTIFVKDRQGNIEDRDAREIRELDHVKSTLETMANRGAELWQQDQYLMREVLAKKMADELKNTDLDNMTKRVLDNETFRRAIAQWKPWSFIRRIGEEWGAEAVERIQEEAEKMDPGLTSIAKTNRSFLRAAYTREGEMFMRNWRSAAVNPATGASYGELRNRNAMTNFLGAVTQPPPAPAPPPPPATFTTWEQSWFNVRAKEMSKEDPTRPLTYHITAAQREYLEKYRPKILQQVSQEGAWFTRRGISTDNRQHEIFDQLRTQATMPQLTPRPTSAEERGFKRLASDLKNLPSEHTKEALREVQGAREVVFYMTRQDETEFVRISKLLEQGETELSAAQRQLAAARAPDLRAAAQAKVDRLSSQIADLQSEFNDRENIWNKHKSTFTTLETEERRIKATLARKVKP